MSKVMLLAGLAKHIPYDPSYAYVGIDYGAYCALQENIPLRCAIGDFDSVSEEEKKQIMEYTEIVELSAHKDETDTEIAVFYALEQQYDEIVLYGGLGGRIDHTLANLHLIMYRDLPITLMDEHHYIRVLKKGAYTIPKRFHYLSFIALEKSCISEQGVAYPLQERWIEPSDIYPISNEILDDEAKIILHEGRVLMIQCEDTK